MKILICRYALAAAAIISSVAAMAQDPIYNVPGLGGYQRQKELNQLESLRNLQMLRETQEILLMQQQRETLQAQQHLLERQTQEQQQGQAGEAPSGAKGEWVFCTERSERHWTYRSHCDLRYSIER